MSDIKSNDSLLITKYTSFNIRFEILGNHTIFHANGLYFRGPWYDWCMIEFDDNEVGG